MSGIPNRQTCRGYEEQALRFGQHGRGNQTARHKRPADRGSHERANRGKYEQRVEIAAQARVEDSRGIQPVDHDSPTCGFVASDPAQRTVQQNDESDLEEERHSLDNHCQGASVRKAAACGSQIHATGCAEFVDRKRG